MADETRAINSDDDTERKQWEGTEAERQRWREEHAAVYAALLQDLVAYVDAIELQWEDLYGDVDVLAEALFILTDHAVVGMSMRLPSFEQVQQRAKARATARREAEEDEEADFEREPRGARAGRIERWRARRSADALAFTRNRKGGNYDR